MVKLGIIIPTLNERSNLETLLPEIVTLYPDAYIILVDDNSTDGTHQYLQTMYGDSHKIEWHVRERRMGIGSAHKFGLKRGIELDCDFLVTLDADGTHRPADIKKLVSLNYSFDVVVGSRYEVGGAITNWSLFRKLLTKAGHLSTRVFFGSDIDMSSGMRSYKVGAIPLEAINSICPDDYAFFFTSILVLQKCNLRIGQQSIVLTNRGYGNSKMTINLMIKGVRLLFLYGFRIKKIKI